MTSSGCEAAKPASLQATALRNNHGGEEREKSVEKVKKMEAERTRKRTSTGVAKTQLLQEAESISKVETTWTPLDADSYAMRECFGVRIHMRSG